LVLGIMFKKSDAPSKPIVENWRQKQFITLNKSDH
jgi:hypothetical protein